MRKMIPLILLMALSSQVHAATRYIPVVNGFFTTGQWYSDGEQSSMGGNLGITFIPAVRFSSALSLIPSLESVYRGTRSSEELAGGNTLFQDTWENAVGLKAVHALNDKWKVKERFSAHMKWFRETSDETWNHGLYDYRTYTLGGEVERSLGQKSNLSLGYDFTYLQFPNYVSLESQQSDALSREYAADHPLNNFIHLVSVKSNFPIPGGIDSTAQLFVSPRFYTDQTLVKESGLLSSEKRKDSYVGANWGLQKPFRLGESIGMMASLNYGYSMMNSNQNHYDARFTQFVSNYYDYGQHRIGGGSVFSFGRTKAGPMSADLGVSYVRRSYSDRTIQSAEGNYLGEKLYINESSVDLGFGYPLSKNFRLRVSSSFGKTTSNNQYEQVYRYNYTNSNYQFGFTYDY